MTNDEILDIVEQVDPKDWFSVIVQIAMEGK